MAQRISQFFEQYVKGIYFPELRFTDILEILIITFLIYQIMVWIKNTNAWHFGTCGIHTGGSHFTDAYDPVAGKRSSSSYGCGGSGRFST